MLQLLAAWADPDLLAQVGAGAGARVSEATINAQQTSHPFSQVEEWGGAEGGRRGGNDRGTGGIATICSLRAAPILSSKAALLDASLTKFAKDRPQQMCCMLN